MLPHVLLIKDPETFQQKVAVIMDLSSAGGIDPLTHAAGHDNGGFDPHFPADAVDEPVHHGSGAEDCTGTHTVDRVAADDFSGSVQTDARQLGSLGSQRLLADAHAGADHAAPERALRVYNRDGGTGAQVKNDQRQRIFCTGCHGIHDAVTAKGGGIIYFQSETCLKGGRHLKEFFACNGFGSPQKGAVQRRHDRGENAAFCFFRIDASHLQNAAEDRGVFIFGFLPVGGNPGGEKNFAVLHAAEYDVGVAGIQS